MEIYDTVLASTLENTDKIFYNNDYVELTSTLDETDTIMVVGYSHVSGENVTYFIPADVEVDLWMV